MAVMVGQTEARKVAILGLPPFETADRALSKRLYFAGALGARQELRHVLVLS
jgi:hypothetical protein